MLIIMDDMVAQKLLPIITGKSLRAPYSKHILEWVKEYYNVYGTAPREAIQDIYEQKKSHMRDGEASSAVGDFLESLSDEYDPSNYTNMEFHVKDCESYIRENNLRDFSSKLDGLIQVGEVDKAEALIGSYERTGIPVNQGVSLVRDIREMSRAFYEEATPLFTLDGDLGKMIGPYYRGDLSSILAPMKMGKSWALLYIAECAMKAGLKVVFLNLETRDFELRKRAWKSLRWCPDTSGVVSIPQFLPDVEPNTIITPETTYRVSYQNVQKQGADFSDIPMLEKELLMRYRGGDVRYITLPSNATTIADLEAILDNLTYYDNFEADVVIVDYADLLFSSERDYRQKLNDIWLNIRRIAQERNIHVATVSQTNRSGMSGAELEAEQVAEDARKIAHISSLVGLYASNTEKEHGIINAKLMVSRYRRETFDTCTVLQCLDIGRFYVDSCMKKLVSS